MLMASAHADDRDGRGRGALYNIAHFDVIPATVGGVDFLQVGYALLFKYRDASKGDPGLQSFRLLNIIAPETNHSEIVQVWSSRDAYERHLASRHTIDFRFNVQGSFANCCVGSPIDDRQYQLVQSFNAPWQSIPALGVGTSGALYVVTYAEFLPDEQAVTTTICPYCGVGCNLELHVQDGDIVNVTSPDDHDVTRGNLCIKGRFGYDYVKSPRRA